MPAGERWWVSATWLALGLWLPARLRSVSHWLAHTFWRFVEQLAADVDLFSQATADRLAQTKGPMYGTPWFFEEDIVLETTDRLRQLYRLGKLVLFPAREAHMPTCAVARDGFPFNDDLHLLWEQATQLHARWMLQ